MLQTVNPMSDDANPTPVLTVTKTTERDLEDVRGITPAVQAMFKVKNKSDGWIYYVKTRGGQEACRFKSYWSARPKGPEGDRWAKYRWLPDKPEGADYCYPAGQSLTEAIRAARGRLYLVGGEMAVMAMMSAGYMNVTSFFGDSAIPATFANDMKAWGVSEVVLIPDRDHSGEQWAVKLAAALNAINLFFTVLALPTEFSVNHGADVNDLWIKHDCEVEEFRAALEGLEEWPLPAPQGAPSAFEGARDKTDVELPEAFLTAIEARLGVDGPYRASGWSRKPVRCPFHDDSNPSAYFNRQKGLLHCFSGCSKTYLAKETGERLGVRLADYLPPLVSPNSKGAPLVTLPAQPQPAQAGPHHAALTRALRPQLPAGAVDEGLMALASGGRAWLDGYVEWAKSASPLTPKSYHEAMGLWLIAVMTARRVVLRLGGENIFPNLYILIVGRSSIYRKSTAMKLARRVLDRANMGALLLPEEASAEALFEELSGIAPKNFDALSNEARQEWLWGRLFAAQRSIMLDEASTLFGNLKKEYMQGLAEILLRGYDGDSGRYTKTMKGAGMVSLKAVCLSFLGATTPVMYGKYIGIEENENGFAARFAVVTPDEQPPYAISDGVIEVPAALADRLNFVSRHVLPRPVPTEPPQEPQTPDVIDALADPQALTLLNGYRKALNYDMVIGMNLSDRYAASYARLGTMAVKVALLLATIDAAETGIRIEARHAAAAINIVEDWRESLHRIDADVARAMSAGPDDKIIDFLRSRGAAGSTARDVTRSCGIRDHKLTAATLQGLMDAGEVECVKIAHEGRGRPALVYRLVNADTLLTLPANVP
jgi:hypothetical protein